MSSSYGRPETFRLIVHPALAVFVSVTSTLSIVWLISRFMGLASPGVLTIVSVVVAPLVEAGIGNLLYRERAGVANRVRELIIMLLLLYAIASLVRSGPFGLRFIPSGAQLVPVAAAAFSWLQASGIHSRLRGRESLLRGFQGLHGEELRHALVDRQHDMAVTVRELRGVKRSVMGTVLFTCGLAIAAAFVPSVGLPMMSAAFVMLVANIAVSIVVIGVVSSFLDEYEANGVGIAVPYRILRRRTLVVIPIVLVAVVLALILARPDDLLPFDRVLAFFRWFLSLFERGVGQISPPEIRQLPRSPISPELLRQLLEESAREGPPLWLRVLAVLFRRLAVALLVVTAATLTFGPLLSRDFRAALKRVHLRDSLRRLVQRVRARFVILVRWLGMISRRKRHAAPAPGKPALVTSETVSTGKTWRPSILKRRQMDRAVSVFQAIAEWGSKHGTRYRPNEGAREYLARLADIKPECSRDLDVCGESFWIARYSRLYLPRKQMRAYVAAARRITATG